MLWDSGRINDVKKKAASQNKKKERGGGAISHPMVLDLTENCLVLAKWCTIYDAWSNIVVFFSLDKPENVKLMVNDSAVCKGDVISITCSADGKPAVHTYQLFENEVPV